MIQILFLFVVGLQVVFADDFDPTKFNYCNYSCGKTEHTACKCNTMRGKNKKIIMDNYMDYRKDMVEAHNEYRNLHARGDSLEKYKFPSASNMHVMNYDLELEYIAYCHIKTVYWEHDSCRGKHNEQNSGQNIYGLEKIKSGTEFHRSQIAFWYAEIKDITNLTIIDRFFDNDNIKVPGHMIAHFTGLIWGTSTHLGCARAYMDENPVASVAKYVSLCNYGSTLIKLGGNIEGMSIYKKGKPCSECPKDEKCNKDYKGGKWDSLCGPLKPIPTHAPYEKKNKENKPNANGTSHGGISHVYGNYKNIPFLVFLLLVVVLSLD